MERGKLRWTSTRRLQPQPFSRGKRGKPAATSSFPAVTQSAFRLAGLPGDSWAFAVCIWIAVVIALCTNFWLQLEAPASAALTVAILAEPTRGQALEKAAYRLIATIIGVAASIAIVGFLSQARDLILAAFAVWLGLCVYAAGLLDGYRTYAAVLSGYTVRLIAVQQLDSPQRVFESSVARGAAIAVGVLSITLMNDLLFAPDRHPRLVAQLAAIHRRIRDYAKAMIRNEPTDSQAIAALIRELVALRPEITSLATEASSGPVRSAAARSASVALVAELHAIRVLDALPEVRRNGNGAVDLPIHHRCSWRPTVGGGERTARRRISVHLARRGPEFMNSLQAIHRVRGPNRLRPGAFRAIK